jgi:CTP:molybdopterin cytidylyltransferase MocA
MKGRERVTGQGDIPAVILASGEGTRIGGRKAHVRLGGRRLVSHVIDRLAPQAGPLALDAGPDADLGGFGLPVLPDAVPGLGPLGGILAAMRWAEGLGAGRVLTVAVDMPFMPRDLVRRLTGAAERAAYAVSRMPRRGSGPSSSRRGWRTRSTVALGRCGTGPGRSARWAFPSRTRPPSSTSTRPRITRPPRAA